MSDHDTERAAPDTGGAPTRKSDRKRKLALKAAEMADPATKKALAASLEERMDGTIIDHGKFITKAKRDARRANYKTRGPRPAATTTPPNAKKIVYRAGGPSRDVLASTDSALAASSSTGGGGGGGRSLRHFTVVPDMGDAADQDALEANLNLVGDAYNITDATPYTTLFRKLWSAATPATKRDVVAKAKAEKKYASPFHIKDDAHAKFFGDPYLRRAVGRFAQSHTLPLEADPNTKMTPDGEYEVLVELVNIGHDARGLPLITADDLKAKPLFRRLDNGHYDPIKANWAALRTNLCGWPVDATGALDPEKVAIFNCLPVVVAVTKDNKPVPISAMRLVRKLVHTANPTVDISITRFNKLGKPESNSPTLDRLTAFSLAFMGSDVDCGDGTCPFPTARQLDALRKSAQAYALETFVPSLCEGAVKHKLKAKRKRDGGGDGAELELDGGGDDAELAELVGRVTPERVAAVFTHAPTGWHVDPTAAAWAEMGITLDDVVEFVKYVDEQAEKEGVVARV